MPTRKQTHVDTMLTNISVKYFQDDSMYIADKVFPVVPVVKQSDRYFKYKKEDWFNDDAEERALGDESAGGDYDIDNTPTYFCRKFAYHKDVFEEDRTNSDDPLTPDEDATEFVADKLKLRKEVAWATTYFKTGVWGTDLTGVSAGANGTSTLLHWNDANSTPIETIRAQRTAVQEVTGKRPNVLVLGQKVYDALCDHPDILDRIKFTQRGMVTADILCALFEVDKILVAGAIKNTAKKGHDATLEFIFGKGALLCYTTNRPGLRTATAGYIFSWKGLLGANAYGGRILRLPIPLKGDGAERIEGEQAFDMKVVAADLGVFFNGIVA
jgi:hypothetical protein